MVTRDQMSQAPWSSIGQPYLDWLASLLVDSSPEGQPNLAVEAAVTQPAQRALLNAPFASLQVADGNEADDNIIPDLGDGAVPHILDQILSSPGAEGELDGVPSA